MKIRYKIIIIVIAVLANLFIVSCNSSDDSIDIDPDISAATADDKEDIEYQNEAPIPTVSDAPDESEAAQAEADTNYKAMEVHFIDVGEGDSTLIKCENEAMLIDAGTPDKGSAIRLYLKQQGISHLKYMLLTH